MKRKPNWEVAGVIAISLVMGLVVVASVAFVLGLVGLVVFHYRGIIWGAISGNPLQFLLVLLIPAGLFLLALILSPLGKGSVGGGDASGWRRRGSVTRGYCQKGNSPAYNRVNPDRTYAVESYPLSLRGRVRPVLSLPKEWG